MPSSVLQGRPAEDSLSDRKNMGNDLRNDKYGDNSTTKITLYFRVIPTLAIVFDQVSDIQYIIWM